MYIMSVIFCLLSAVSRLVGFALFLNFSYYYYATLDQRLRYCVPSVAIFFTVVLHCNGMHL